MGAITTAQKTLYEDDKGTVVQEETGLIVLDFFPNVEITGKDGVRRLEILNSIPGGPFNMLIRHHGPWVLTKTVIDITMVELPKNIDRVAVFIGLPELAANALTQKNIFSALEWEVFDYEDDARLWLSE